LLVGKDDWLYSKQGKLITAGCSQQLTRLGLANSYTVIDGIGHMLPEAMASGQVIMPGEIQRLEQLAIEEQSLLEQLPRHRRKLPAGFHWRKLKLTALPPACHL
jgi:hypothetical protein